MTRDTRDTSPSLAWVVAGLAVLSVCLPLAAGPVAAGHDPPANYTVDPRQAPADHRPGNADATYFQSAVVPVEIETVDYIAAYWTEGGFTGCGPGNADAFGIDRGNDDPGTHTDEQLTDNVKRTVVNEDKFVAEFYGEGDFGPSVGMGKGDQFVSLTSNCFDNPDEPGWYQIESRLNGTKPNGEYVNRVVYSHYFWVCDCASEQEAREQLGPPPSEPTATATPTATAEPTPTPEPTPTRTPPAEGTPFPSPTPTPTPTATPAGGTATAASAPADPTEAETDGGGGGSDGGDGGGASAGGTGGDGARSEDGAGGTATTTGEGWDEYVRDTPTTARGPGFGATAALLAIAAGALLSLRRSD